MIRTLRRNQDQRVRAIVSQEVDRAVRMIDLDRPIVLDPKPIAQLRDGALRHGLKKLLEGKSFYISTFKELVEIARVYPPPGLMDILQPLHCMDWSEMDPEFRHDIQQQILACLLPVEVQGKDDGDAGEAEEMTA